jgi:hypothetical protein
MSEKETPQDSGNRQARENEQRNQRHNFQYALSQIGRIARDAYHNDSMWWRYVRAYDELLRLARIVAVFDDAVQIPARLNPPAAATEKVDVKPLPAPPTVVQIRSTSLPGSAVPTYGKNGSVSY